MNVTVSVSNVNIFVDRCPESLINTIKEIIMPTVQEIKDAIAAESQEVAARIAELQAKIEVLLNQASNGGAATEQELQEILDGVKSIFNPTQPGGEQPTDPTDPVDPEV